MTKHIYMSEDELKSMEVLMSNDYVGRITNVRWVGYFGKHRVSIEFESQEELDMFCDMYDYRLNDEVEWLLLKRRTC